MQVIGYTTHVVRHATSWGYQYEYVDTPVYAGNYEIVGTPVALGGYLSTHLSPRMRSYLRAVDVYLARVLFGAPEGMTISEYFARMISRLSGRTIGESMRRFHWLLALQVGRWVNEVDPRIPAHEVAAELYDVFEDVR